MDFITICHESTTSGVIAYAFRPVRQEIKTNARNRDWKIVGLFCVCDTPQDSLFG
jgi:hypothetical protein